MSIELRNLKGTDDYMPDEQEMRNEVEGKLREVFERYGYRPLETPSICYLDILKSKYAGGAEILKEIYRFKDQGQRDIGLRYDLTVPLARVVGMNPEIRLPFKRYEIGRVFRDGPVKAGRNREFVQCDVDVVGVKSVMAEAELMIMANDIYAMLGLDVYISFNNRKLLSGIIRYAGVAEGLEGSVILSIDKLEKIGEDGVRSELIEKGIDEKLIERLFGFLRKDETELLEMLRDVTENELIRQGITEIDELMGYLKIAGIEKSCRFSPYLARGLEIYTGTVFEVFLKDGSITSSIGAGGRYDRIIGALLNNGTEYPAVGMTFGLDVICYALLLMGKRNVKPPSDLYIIPVNAKAEALNLVTMLRRRGVFADMEMDGRRLKKSLEYAGNQSIPFVIVFGEDEIKTGRVRIRNMKDGREIEVPIKEISNVLRSREKIRSFNAKEFVGVH